MQTINQQKRLRTWTEIMQESRPNWEHIRNGHPCRQEDFEADRFDRHILPPKVDWMVLKACIGIVVVFYTLSWAGVI
jgi:hypothetical protein